MIRKYDQANRWVAEISPTGLETRYVYDELGARYCDSSLGRFVSADPFAGFMSDPMSLHNYQYAHANSTRHTDPKEASLVRHKL
jgi:RHS repeat-associated protein